MTPEPTESSTATVDATLARLKHASARGVAWNVLQNVGGRLVSLAVVAILARLLAKEAFAAIALGLAASSLADILISQGLVEFIAQRKDISDEQLDTAFWINVVLGVVLTAAIALLSEPIARLISDDAAIVPVMRWLSLSLLVRATCVVPIGILTRQMQFRALSLRTLFGSLFSGVVGITAALNGLGVYSLVLQVLAGEVAAAILLWWAVPWRPRRRFSRRHFDEQFAFGLPVVGASLLNFVGRRLDTFVVGRALGLSVLGVYTMGQRLFQIANQILNKSGDAVAMSALSRLADAPDRRRDAFYKVVRTTAAICFPLYAALAILARPSIALVFGPKWDDSAPVLAIFGAAGLPLSLSYMHGAALKSAGRTRAFLLTHVALTVVYIPALLIGVTRGVDAAAVAYLVGCSAVVPVEIVLLRAALGVRLVDYLRALAAPTIATGAMTAASMIVISRLVALHPSLQLLVAGAAGLVTYVATIRLVGPDVLSGIIEPFRSRRAG